MRFGNTSGKGMEGNGSMLSWLFNKKRPIGSDIGINPDPNLSGYQDDIATGDKEDEVQHEQGDTPEDVTLMPEEELKEELDKLAIDEHDSDIDDVDIEEGSNREHIEDVDEGDGQ